ncbi:hypothetical protein LTR64_003016 [Lithohypha guttulata]|uniref:uncharacterized protein n=1 Tax=Lithohypha guttulata TaxID=1690604 RepID=UPI002DDFC870|nr:hypothetical protein LTR51_000760 [Lithohypha guttulata]
MLSTIRLSLVACVTLTSLLFHPTTARVIPIDPTTNQLVPRANGQLNIYINTADPSVAGIRNDARPRITEGAKDAVIMARLACALMMLENYEGLYERYFESPPLNDDEDNDDEDDDQEEEEDGGGQDEAGVDPARKQFVQTVFCAIAGITPECSINDIFTQRGTNPKLDGLTYSVGKYPGIEDHDRNFEHDAVYAATLYQDILTEYNIGNTDDAAIMEIHRRAFDFPNIEDIFENRGCQALGAADSGLMTTLGAHILHELVHWHHLTRTPENGHIYNQLITHDVYKPNENGEEVEETHDYIDDYDRDEYDDKDLDPPDGYGPQHAHQLVVNDEQDSFRNADNYRWFAVSLYWH